MYRLTHSVLSNWRHRIAILCCTSLEYFEWFRSMLSQGLHQLGKFPELSDEIACQECYYYVIPMTNRVRHFGLIRNMLYLLTWILGVVSKQLRLLHGWAGDSTTSVNSLSPQMSELVEDAVASWCGDIVGHFWLIRNEHQKFVELKFELFSFNTFDVSQIFWQRIVQTRPKYSYCISLKGLCWVSVCWILNNALCSMSWVFSGFYFVPHRAINIWHHMSVIFQIYIIYFWRASLEGVQFEFVQSFPVV